MNKKILLMLSLATTYGISISAASPSQESTLYALLIAAKKRIVGEFDYRFLSPHWLRYDNPRRVALDKRLEADFRAHFAPGEEEKLRKEGYFIFQNNATLEFECSQNYGGGYYSTYDPLTKKYSGTYRY